MLFINSGSDLSQNKRSPKSGFTLIELLLVIAVITILASITFGIFNGVKNLQNRSRAKAELTVIAQALEQFKSRNGDYPWVSGDPLDAEPNGQVLFQALVGWMEFSGSGNSATFGNKATVPTSGPETYIDISKLTYGDPAAPDNLNPEIDNLSTAAPTDYTFLDPWGNPYVYLYGKTAVANTWQVFGYHLYSTGVDKEDSSEGLTTSTGVMEPSHRTADKNADNIYAGE